MTSRPPLPPAARIEPTHTPHHEPEPHTIPGWIAALIYLACTVVLGWAIVTKVLPGGLG